MMQATKEVSYFKLCLEDYLQQSHPERVNDLGLIDSRSNQALEIFEQEIRNGQNVHIAMQIAKEALFQGLYFSKYNTIENIVEEEFPEISSSRKKEFCLKMLSVCEEIFLNYDLNDDFEYTEQFDELYLEITGCIHCYIEKYGI